MSRTVSDLTREVPSTTEFPATVKSVPIAAAPLVVSVVTEVAVAFSAVSVEVPVTPSVPPMVVLFVIAAESSAEAPAVRPASVVAPVTPSVVPTVAAPVTSADASVDAPHQSASVVPDTSRVVPPKYLQLHQRASVDAPALSTQC